MNESASTATSIHSMRGRGLRVGGWKRGRTSVQDRSFAPCRLTRVDFRWGAGAGRRKLCTSLSAERERVAYFLRLGRRWRGASHSTLVHRKSSILRGLRRQRVAQRRALEVGLLGKGAGVGLL